MSQLKLVAATRPNAALVVWAFELPPFLYVRPVQQHIAKGSDCNHVLTR
ncbi:hypothetical protein [Polaromonas aquatica]